MGDMKKMTIVIVVILVIVVFMGCKYVRGQILDGPVNDFTKMLSVSVTFNTEGHAIVQNQLYPAINYQHILLLETTVHWPPHQRKRKERNEA